MRERGGREGRGGEGRGGGRGVVGWEGRGGEEQINADHQQARSKNALTAAGSAGVRESGGREGRGGDDKVGGINKYNVGLAGVSCIEGEGWQVLSYKITIYLYSKIYFNYLDSICKLPDIYIPTTTKKLIRICRPS